MLCKNAINTSNTKEHRPVPAERHSSSSGLDSSRVENAMKGNEETTISRKHRVQVLVQENSPCSRQYSVSITPVVSCWRV